MFLARIRVGGKLIWRSLKTKTITVAKLKLADLESEERSRLEVVQVGDEAKTTFRTMLVQEIRRAPSGPGLASDELVEFLAFGGFRKSGAAAVRWSDVDLPRGEITVRGDAETVRLQSPRSCAGTRKILPLRPPGTSTGSNSPPPGSQGSGSARMLRRRSHRQGIQRCPELEHHHGTDALEPSPPGNAGVHRRGTRPGFQSQTAVVP